MSGEIRQLKVCGLPDNTLVLANVCVHNPNDFGPKSLFLSLSNPTGSTNQKIQNIKKVIYRSEPHPSCPIGHLGLGLIQRSHHNWAFNEIINVKVYETVAKSLTKITIHFRKHKIGQNLVSIHEDEIKEVILRSLKGHYFSDGQALILQVGSNNYVLEPHVLDEGYINPQTKIDLISSDIMVNLVSAQILKRDLFKDDYNFEEIGIGGLNHELIRIFRRALSSRAIKPSIVKKLGIKHVKGILLYGPPGTGKTLIARNIGKLLTPNPPKIVNGPEILSKYHGESEAGIRNLFEDARKDSENNGENAQLHVIIFDEIDAICRTRGTLSGDSGVGDRVVNQLLSMIQGVHELDNIFIIAMTNRKDLLDPALLRAGRIEVHIEINLPDEAGRAQILRIHTKTMSSSHMLGHDVDLTQIAKLTENYSGAELEAVVKNASTFAIHETLTIQNKEKESKDEDVVVRMEHFLRAVEEIVPSFGNFNKEIKNLLPENYLWLTDKHERTHREIVELTKKSTRIKSALVYGSSGTGKSSLVYQLGYELRTKFTRVVRPIDLVNFSEDTKARYLANIFADAYLSEQSLVILDDVEILINFANLDFNISFSNKLYQTLMTLLKTPPNNPKHTLTIFVTCGDEKLANILEKACDKRFELTELEVEQAHIINKKLNLEIDDACLFVPISIGRLINL